MITDSEQALTLSRDWKSQITATSRSSGRLLGSSEGPRSTFSLNVTFTKTAGSDGEPEIRREKAVAGGEGEREGLACVCEREGECVRLAWEGRVLLVLLVTAGMR